MLRAASSRNVSTFQAHEVVEYMYTRQGTHPLARMRILRTSNGPSDGEEWSGGRSHDGAWDGSFDAVMNGRSHVRR